MATRDLVPRADSEGGIGTTLKRWAAAWFDAINGKDISSGVATTAEVEALSTTYAPISHVEQHFIGGSDAFLKANTAFYGLARLATEAEVITGTDTAKAVTPAGVAAAAIFKSLGSAKGDLITFSAANTPARLGVGASGQFLRVSPAGLPAWGKSNIYTGSFSRDMATASGLQSITGIGFTPSNIIFFGNVNATQVVSFGMYGNSGNHGIGSIGSVFYSNATIDIIAFIDGGNSQTASVASLDTDGFTLLWGKTGLPTGTMNVFFTAFEA